MPEVRNRPNNIGGYMKEISVTAEELLKASVPFVYSTDREPGYSLFSCVQCGKKFKRNPMTRFCRCYECRKSGPPPRRGAFKKQEAIKFKASLSQS